MCYRQGLGPTHESAGYCTCSPSILNPFCAETAPALLLKCPTFRGAYLSKIFVRFDLVARLRFLFVRPCAARSPAQVTWTRGRGHPTVPGARWRSPLALTSDHPPPIHPFVFEAVAPRKLVSQLREITFSLRGIEVSFSTFHSGRGHSTVN